LSSLLQVPFHLVLPLDAAATLPSLLLGALLPALVVRLAGRAGLRGADRAAAGVAAAIGGGVAPLLALPDNYVLMAVLLSAAALAADDLRRRRRGPWLLGALLGAAMLARTDGALYAAAAGLLLLRRPADLARVAATAAAVVAPFWARQLAVFGSISPSAASGRILFIREYRELFGTGGALTIDHLLSWGPGPLLASRLEAAGYVVGQWWAVLFGLIGAPIALAGLLRRRLPPVLRLPLIAFALHTAWSVVVAAPHLPTGNYLHGAAAFFPFGAIAALLGLRRAVAALARRRRPGDPRRLLRRYRAVYIASLCVSAAMTTLSLAAPWREHAALRASLLREAAPLLAPGTVVVSADPGAFYLRGGYPGVQTPDEPAPVILRAAAAYGAAWAFVERGEVVEALAPLMKGEAVGGFFGPCAAVRDAAGSLQAGLYHIGAPCP
jgi:hypothetical protein